MRHAAVQIIYYLFHRRGVFEFIGRLNRRWNFLSTIFVMYPATDEYANAYVPLDALPIMKWTPYLVGFFVQNGKVGLKFVISSTEADFRNRDNIKKLEHMVKYAQAIQMLVGAKQISYSGILPGILNEYRLIRRSIEAKVTVEAVIRAEKLLRERTKLSDDTPVVLLGGAGFIGRRVARGMSGKRVHIADPILAANTDRCGWVEMFKGRSTIILNIANKEALANCVELLWPEAIVLNEVYPEPNKKTISSIKLKGCPLYHIVGLKAFSFPSFPKAYKGGIPCCAGRIARTLNPILTKLA